MGFLIVALSFMVTAFLLKYETILEYLYGSDGKPLEKDTSNDEVIDEINMDVMAI